MQNYPNPFNPTTTIYYSVGKESNITIQVYNLLGKKVKTLINNRRRPAGYHYLQWDGRNDDGRRVASGVYLYQMRSDENVLTKKMVLIR